MRLRLASLICRALLAAVGLLAWPMAHATTYSLPAAIGSGVFAGCSFFTGSTYQCGGSIDFGNDNSVVLNVTSNMTLQLGGNFTAKNNLQINASPGVLSLVVGGSVTINNNMSSTVNITAGGNVSLGNNTSMTGNITAGGALTIGSGTVNGVCQPSNPACTGGSASVPTVTTVAASGISGTGATLNGTVSSNGASTTVSFNYGLTTSYGTTVTAAQSPLASGASGSAVSYVLSGLSCGTTYNFRVTATNSAGTSNGGNLSFTTSACVDHYELSLPTTGVSCSPVTATVTACANSSSPCNSAATSVNGTTATLSASAGTLGATSVSFNASGVASTTLSYPAANGAAVSVTLSGEQVVATAARKCCPNGSSCSVANSCSVTLNSAGFIVAAAAGGAAVNIPTQVAGSTSGTFWLRAIQTNTSTNACQPTLTGSKPVNVAYKCNNPATCLGGNLMSVNGTAVQANDNAAGSLSYQSLNFNFDANGNAPFSLNYRDVGQTTLWFSATVNSATVSGSSNAFVTKPDHFGLSGVQRTATPLLVNPAAADASGGKFVKAGEAFTATITAYTSGASPTPTPNFGKESSPEGVLLTQALVLPSSGGNLGTLSNATVAGGSFSNGVATVTNLAWSEVGIITLTPSLVSGNYLGSGGTPPSTPTGIGNVGRFYPDHFAIGGTLLSAGCTAGTNPYTYFGQDGITTQFTVTAQNSANATTQNYFGTLAKLDLTSYTALGFTASALPTGSSLGSGASAPSGAWPAAGSSPGVASVTARHKIGRPTPNLATEATVTLSSAPSDGDVAAGTPTQLGTPTKLRFGRLQLQNAFGSDLLDLGMPMVAQYYGVVGGFTGFITNTDDSCTTLATNNVNLVNYSAGMPAITVKSVNAPTGKLVAGVGTLVLNKPGSALSSPGHVDVLLHLGDGTTTPNLSTLTCPTSTPANPLGSSVLAGSPDMTYLATNSCTSGGTLTANYNRNPTARATFGTYKSPVIFQRENY